MENKLMKNRNIIKKRNQLIKGRYNLTKNEQKLILLSISQIDKEDLEKDKRYYYIDLKKIDNKLSKQNRTRIKQFCKTIETKPLEIERDNGNFLICNWFSDIEYLEETQQLEVSFSTKLIPYLLELKDNFTRYDLREVINFNSGYSIRFYELFSSYMNTRHKEFTLELEGEKGLFEMFKLPKSLQQISKLKEKVLNVVEKDINKNSNIKFTYSLIKQGRKFTHINFKLNYNNEVLEKRKLENGSKYWEQELNRVLNYYSLSIEERIEQDLNLSSNDLDYFWNGYFNNNFIGEKFIFGNDIFYLKDFELSKMNEEQEEKTYILKVEDLKDKKRGLGKVNSNCQTLYRLFYFLKSSYTEETELETNLFSQQS